MPQHRDKTDVADRERGGPGSEANTRKPGRQSVQPGEPTNPDRSRVSGGGGERDRHHTHDPKMKG